MFKVNNKDSRTICVTRLKPSQCNMRFAKLTPSKCFYRELWRSLKGIPAGWNMLLFLNKGTRAICEFV